MSESTAFYIATHLLCVAIGYFGARAVATRAVGHTVDVSTPHTRRADMRLIVTQLIACAVVVAIGVQAYLSNREDQRQRECFAGIVDVLSDATAKRGAAAMRLDKAQARRDDALDSVVLVVIGMRDRPPTKTENDFGRALARFADARGKLTEVRLDVARVRERNPVPTVHEGTCIA